MRGSKHKANGQPSTVEINTTRHIVNGGEIFVRKTADAHLQKNIPIVLVHGQASSAYMMPLMRHLGRDHPVYSPDLPGYGHSYKPGHALTIAELGDALADWMDSAGIRRAVLLGNSMGCQIAAECAVQHPKKVAALILQSPTAEPGSRTYHQQWFRNNLNHMRENGTGIIPFVDLLRSGIIRSKKTLQYYLEDRIEDKLPDITVPTLVIRGAKDPIISQEWAEEVTRLLPDGRLRVVPGAAHTMVAANPIEMARLSRPFIQDTVGLHSD